MVQETHGQGLALRALILVPAAIVALRADVTKFRGWRQRVREWHAQGAIPSRDYRRDNELWRWRLLALVVCLAALVTSAVLILLTTPLSWLFWSVYALAMIGAAGWNLLGAHVR
jgi:amino acid transporter